MTSSTSQRAGECIRKKGHKPILVTCEEHGGLFTEWMVVGRWWECDYCGAEMSAPLPGRAGEP
jgi:hypothetical protein